MATELATIVADFRTTLATEIAVGGTSGTLQSNTDADGNAIPNGTYFLTLDGDGTQKEYVKCTVTGSALTNIRTISRQGVQASGTVRKHRIGAKVQITNFAHIKYMLDLLDGTTDFDASTPLKYDGVATLTPGSNEFCTVAYADALTFAGAPNGSTTQKGIFELATVAEQGTATANGATGAALVPANANLVKTSSGAGDENKIAILDASGTFANGFIDKARTWGTVQSFTANNCQITSDADSANDAVRSSYLTAQLTAAVPKGSISGTSGEAITAGQGVYLKASDGKLYKVDADADESTFSFVGIALTTVGAADLAVEYAPPGHVVSGLAGLTAGASYYITGTAGTLGTTPGTRFARVARALSTTVMQVEQPQFQASGSFSVTATGNTVVTSAGFRPRKIELMASQTVDGDTSGYSSISMNAIENRCITILGNTSSSLWGDMRSGVCANIVSGSGTHHRATISALSETGFTYANTKTNSPPNYTVYWTAYS